MNPNPAYDYGEMSDFGISSDVQPDDLADDGGFDALNDMGVPWGPVIDSGIPGDAAAEWGPGEVDVTPPCGLPARKNRKATPPCETLGLGAISADPAKLVAEALALDQKARETEAQARTFDRLSPATATALRRNAAGMRQQAAALRAQAATATNEQRRQQQREDARAQAERDERASERTGKLIGGIFGTAAETAGKLAPSLLNKGRGGVPGQQEPEVVEPSGGGRSVVPWVVGGLAVFALGFLALKGAGKKQEK